MLMAIDWAMLAVACYAFHRVTSAIADAIADFVSKD